MLFVPCFEVSDIHTVGFSGHWRDVGEGRAAIDDGGASSYLIAETVRNLRAPQGGVPDLPHINIMRAQQPPTPCREKNDVSPSLNVTVF